MPVRRTLAVLGAVVLVAGLLIWSAPGRADIVVFKDGFALSGKVARGNENITDPVSGQSMTVPKGAFFVIDGARRITFSHQQVQAVDKKDIFANSEPIVFGMRVSRLNSMVMDPFWQPPKDATPAPWNGRWERDFEIITGQRQRYKVQQRLNLLTPQFVKIDALRYNWSVYYMTNELGVDEVRRLLELHPDLRESKEDAASPARKDEPKKKADTGAPKKKNEKPEPVKPKAETVPESVKRLRVARYFTQAGWYDEAEKEYSSILERFPEEKEKVDAAREHLKGLRYLQAVEAVELADQARQYVRAQQLLQRFPRQDVDDGLLARTRRLRAKYETLNATLDQAGRLLNEMAAQTSEKRLQEAAAAIAAELNHDNVSRLEAFLGLGQQAQRDREQKKPVDKTPEQLLALALTGWFLGKDAAEPKVESALHLWSARRFLLDYLKTDDADARDKLLADYQAHTEEVVPFDEMAQIIPNIPPPLPDKLPPVALPIQLKAKNLSYWIQLPPEYHQGRSYPVLIALHQVGESPKAMIERCGRHAAQHGYLLVAPGWGGESGQRYSYSREEHAAVLNVLWDVRRRFQVNSDRVFMLGVGDGGSMAYDVGLSHPDLFAGVVPISGGPHFFAQRYAQVGGNGQNLPFYVVNGTHAGELVKLNHELFERTWVPQAYPSLHVEYGGRGLEWFPAELSPIFDWMDRKKRATAFPSLGKREMLTMRPDDNHFYWIGVDSIRPANVNDSRRWNNFVIPAKVSANIAEGNVIVLATSGIKRLTVWLGRDTQGRDMIDFTKPLTIRVNGGAVVSNKPVKPSLQTMLEDLYQRGDRQRLFFVKERIDLK